VTSVRAKRVRLDQLIVERGLAESRSRAQALLIGGRVRVGAGDQARLDRKPGDLVDPATTVEVETPEPYVSRGGHKLAAALEAFAVDPSGRALPIDPSRVNVDLPIVATRDTALLRLLADVRAAAPALFERVSEIRRVEKGELLVRLTTVPVRAMADLSASRLAETVPVEEDLARRRARVAELDLRFRDQVIARLQ